jgi:hypothetical protein
MAPAAQAAAAQTAAAAKRAIWGADRRRSKVRQLDRRRAAEAAGAA